MGPLDSLLSLIGRARQPQLPPVNRMTPEELTRMEFAALQAGDQGKVDRLQLVRGRIAEDEQANLPPEIQAQIIEPKKRGKVGQFIDNSLQARQSLVNALAQD